MKVLLCFILALGLASDNYAIDEPSDPYLVALLQAAKVSGMCGVFYQMGKFQDATQLPGGDEFILRFIKTEAARLGLTLEAFLDRCASSTKMYKLAVASAKEGQR